MHFVPFGLQSGWQLALEKLHNHHQTDRVWLVDCHMGSPLKELALRMDWGFVALAVGHHKKMHPMDLRLLLRLGFHIHLCRQLVQSWMEAKLHMQVAFAVVEEPQTCLKHTTR
jgi:hypothetical protein